MRKSIGIKPWPEGRKTGMFSTMNRKLLAIAALVVLGAGAGFFALRHRTTEAAPPPQSWGANGAPPPASLAALPPAAPEEFRPYVALKPLPPAPAHVTHAGKNLTLVERNHHTYLADHRGRYYDCGRDRRGRVIPVYHHSSRTYPLLYDDQRDRYF